MSLIVGNYITPNKISNLALWLEADRGITSTTASLSGTGVVVVQDTLATFSSDRTNILFTGDRITAGGQTLTITTTGSYNLYVTPSANPSIGTSQSLDVRRNIFMGTEEFNNTTLWQTSDATVSANVTTSPISSSTADLMYPSIVSTGAYVFYTTFATSSVCFSIYAKAGGYNWVRLLKFQDPTSAAADFNLSNGTVGYTNGITSSSIQDIGDGWYRCAIFFTAQGTPSSNNIYRAQIMSGSNSPTVAVDGTKGVYIWGAQLETGSVLSTYQPIGTGSAYTYTKQYPRVSQWSDQSGNNRNFTQATTTSQPMVITSSINTRPTLVFDTDDFLGNSAKVWDFLHNTGSGGTVITVTQAGSQAASYILADNSLSNTRVGYGLVVNSNGSLNSVITNGTAIVSDNLSAVGTVPMETYCIVSDVINPGAGTLSDRSKMFVSINGSTTTNNTSNAVASTGSNALDLQIGARGAGPHSYANNRRIAALLVYSRALTDSELQSLHYYLSTKYAVPLRVGFR